MHVPVVGPDRISHWVKDLFDLGLGPAVSGPQPPVDAHGGAFDSVAAQVGGDEGSAAASTVGCAVNGRWRSPPGPAGPALQNTTELPINWSSFFPSRNVGPVDTCRVFLSSISKPARKSSGSRPPSRATARL